MPSSPSPSSHYQHTERPRQQQDPPDEQQDVQTTVRAKAFATAASFAMRKQWEAKAASFQRGLEHVRRCKAGDACSSSLCHSTRRLMRTVATHKCPKQQGQDCKVCKLWDFLTTQHPQLVLSCGAAVSQPRRGRASAVQRRLVTAQKTQHLRRF